MVDQIFGFDTQRAWHYENGFYLTGSTTRLAKAIAHWELYKKIQNVPGDIVECGVYKGASLVRFLTYRDLLESQYSRKVIGFDTFGKFPVTGRDECDKFIEQFEIVGGDGIPKIELEKALRSKGVCNYELVEGNIFSTIEQYLENNKNLKIALLHIDVDVYDATRFCINTLYDKVSGGGVIVFDDYSSVEGATIAIDEFVAENNINSPIEKMGYYKVPSFMVKR